MSQSATETLSPRIHRPALTGQDIETYRPDGYITVPGIIERDLLDRMSKVIDGLVERSRALTASDGVFDLAPDHSAAAPRLRRISSPTELDDVFVEVVFGSVVGDIAADLIGGPVKFYHAKINFKLPESESTNIQWHQDWPRFPHTNTNLLAVSVPLQARTRENGCIQMIPGSHRKGPLSVWQDGAYVFSCEHGMDRQDFERIVYMECEPGDVLAHHGLAVHASAPNPTPEVAITLTIQYAAADAFAYTAPVIDSRHRNMMVRGEQARVARVEAGNIELPPDFSAGYRSLFACQDEAVA